MTVCDCVCDNRINCFMTGANSATFSSLTSAGRTGHAQRIRGSTAENIKLPIQAFCNNFRMTHILLSINTNLPFIHFVSVRIVHLPVGRFRPKPRSTCYHVISQQTTKGRVFSLGGLLHLSILGLDADSLHSFSGYEIRLKKYLNLQRTIRRHLQHETNPLAPGRQGALGLVRGSRPYHFARDFIIKDQGQNQVETCRS